MTVVEKVGFFFCVNIFKIFSEWKKKNKHNKILLYKYMLQVMMSYCVCYFVEKEHDVFLNKDACISVIGCMYIYIWIYISTLMMMMIFWGTFFSEVLSSLFLFFILFYLKGE